MKLFNLTLLILFSSLAFGQLTWNSKAAIPEFGRYNPISFSIDGKLYVGLGEIPGPEYSKELWEFDPTTNLWTKKTDYPGNGSRLATAFVVDGKAYVGLGESASGRHIDFYEYNPASDSWIQKANFPGGVRYAAGSFVLGDSAFVGLGSCGGPTCYNEDLWMYVPSTNSWTQKANWPGGKVTTPVSFSIGQYGYFGNALTTSATLSNSFYKYDKANDSWSSIASLPGTARRNTTSFILNNEAYVGCGAYNYSNPTFENDFYKYNVANNTWNHFSSNNAFVGRFLGVCKSVSDSVIIAGAGNSENGYLSDFWQLSLGADTCNFTDTTYLSVQDTLSFNINSSSVSSPQYVGVKVYPNPAGSNITIDIANFSLLSNYSLKIYNTLGSVVHSQNVTAATHQISTSGFGGAGTYFLEFYDSNNAKKSRKVLILN